MRIVKISDATVGIAPIPAPFASWPKNITQETIDQINHVYACGSTFLLKTSIKYGTFPIIARIEAITAKDNFM